MFIEITDTLNKTHIINTDKIFSIEFVSKFIENASENDVFYIRMDELYYSIYGNERNRIFNLLRDK